MMDWVRRKHESLEREVLKESDAIITISPTFQKDFEIISGKPIKLLTNGFDSSDLPENWSSRLSSSDCLEILYTGVIDSIRNPIPFLIAFKKVFFEKSKKVMLRFVGKVSENVQTFIASDPWLEEHVKLEGYVAHEAVFPFYQNAHLLLLILTDTKNAQGNIPGKLFEYMATGRPIVALGDPDGDSAKILKDSNAGIVFNHQDTEGIEYFLRHFVPKDDYKTSLNLEKYSRKNLSQQLAQILDAQTDPIS
jgi:glycosyltransferase involved in cell wall biosynthesis